MSDVIKVDNGPAGHFVTGLTTNQKREVLDMIERVFENTNNPGSQNINIKLLQSRIRKERARLGGNND